MDDTYTYPSFDYLNVTYYKPPGYSGTLFYQGVLQRYLNHITLETCSSRYLDPCWRWTGGSQHLLSHRYLGMVTVKLLSLALHLPEELNVARSMTAKRLRLHTTTRCGNEECLRPDHLALMHGKNRIAWDHRPVVRNPKKERETEWLSLPEMDYLKAQMRMGAGDPSVFLINFAERINVSYMTVGEIWLTLRKTMIDTFKGYTL
jgi:hypothetical protein